MVPVFIKKKKIDIISVEVGHSESTQPVFLKKAQGIS